MDADANLPVWSALGHLFFALAGNQLLNLQCRQYTIDGVRPISNGHAPHGHVSIANRFDLFQVMPPRDFVELTKAVVEFFDQLLRREVLCDLREADKVGKEDGSVCIINRLNPIGLL